jgi:hypothetical protein
MNFFKALANLASKVAQDFTQPKQKLQTLIITRRKLIHPHDLHISNQLFFLVV